MARIPFPRIIGRTASKRAYGLACEGAKPVNALLPEKLFRFNAANNAR